MNHSTIPCPHCGEEIPANARFCRHCGSSDSDGWRDEEDYDTDVDDFNYDEYVQQNFPESVTNTETRPIWRLVAVVLLALFALSFLLF